MSFVFVVDTQKRPLDPVHPGRARLLLKAGKAAVLKRYPFTILLKASVEQPEGKPLRLKLNPGSRTTGIAIVDDQSGAVVFVAELSHRGKVIKDALDARRVDWYGFLRTGPKGAKKVRGFQTGDMARVVVPRQLKMAGTYVGKIAARTNGPFNITTEAGTTQGIGHHYCTRLQRSDGYMYLYQERRGGTSSPA
jgi:hypothetical protein